MKLALLTCALLSLLTPAAMAGSSAALVFDDTWPDTADHHSSFRGLRLGASLLDTVTVIRRNFPTDAFWWANGSLEVWYASQKLIAIVRFDEADNVAKLELTPSFFARNSIHARDFADTVFKHYGVKPLEQDDDACFSQSTCFKGMSKMGEYFLIFTITGEVQFHVFKPRY
jgi:hypothetical protein